MGIGLKLLRVLQEPVKVLLVPVLPEPGLGLLLVQQVPVCRGLVVP